MDAFDSRLDKIAQKKGGVNVTMIAEKPSVAKAMALILGHSSQYFEEYQSNGFTVYEYSGTFRGFDAHFRILSVYGHIYR